MHVRYDEIVKKGQAEGIISKMAHPIKAYGNSNNHEVPYVTAEPWANLVEKIASRNRMVCRLKCEVRVECTRVGTGDRGVAFPLRMYMPVLSGAVSSAPHRSTRQR